LYDGKIALYTEHRILQWLLNYKILVEELETNLMSLVIFITRNICSTCFGH